MKYRITTSSPFVDPRLFRDVKTGQQAIVKNGKVIFGGHEFKFYENGPVDGTAVQITVGTNFFCEPIYEIQVEGD